MVPTLRLTSQVFRISLISSPPRTSSLEEPLIECYNFVRGSAPPNSCRFPCVREKDPGFLHWRSRYARQIPYFPSFRMGCLQFACPRGDPISSMLRNVFCAARQILVRPLSLRFMPVSPLSGDLTACLPLLARGNHSTCLATISLFYSTFCHGGPHCVPWQ